MQDESNKEEEDEEDCECEEEDESAGDSNGPSYGSIAHSPVIAAEKASTPRNTRSRKSQAVVEPLVKTGKTFAFTLQGILDAVDFEGVWVFDRATLLSEKAFSYDKIT